MDTSLLPAILAPLGIYALAVPMPGPGFVVITRASIAQGWIHGAAAALGTTTSVLVYAVATILGISALLVGTPWLSGAIQIAGEAYLVWMGLSVLRATVASKDVPGKASGPSTELDETINISFRRGLLVGLGNPKMALFFVGLFSPSLSGDLSTTAQVIVLCGVLLIDLIYHQLLALVAAKGTGMIIHARRWFDTAAGGSMAAFGVFTIVRYVEGL